MLERKGERPGAGAICSPRLTPLEAHRLVGHLDEEPIRATSLEPAQKQQAQRADRGRKPRHGLC